MCEHLGSVVKQENFLQPYGYAKMIEKRTMEDRNGIYWFYQ